jgi:hypothetical protein
MSHKKEVKSQKELKALKGLAIEKTKALSKKATVKKGSGKERTTLGKQVELKQLSKKNYCQAFNRS